MNLQSIDLAALGLFALSVAVGAGSVVLLSGFLPLAARRPQQQGLLGDGLLLLAGLAVLLLAVATLRFAFARLSPAPAMIAGGLAVLAGPLVFQLLPRGLRDSTAGLLLVLLAGGALAALLGGAA